MPNVGLLRFAGFDDNWLSVDCGASSLTCEVVGISPQTRKIIGRDIAIE